MARKLIATLAAAALSLTTLTATPARAADPDDVARFLGAAATLFIIGKAIESSKDTRRHQPQAQAQTAHKPHKPNKPQYHQPPRQAHIPQVVPNRGGGGGHHARAPLPAECLRQVTGANTRYVMGRACLNRNYTSARPLPQSCEMQVRGPGGKLRNAYSVRCLRGQGYQIAGR